MYKIILLLLPILIYAENLKTLLEYVDEYNDLVIAKELLKKSKLKEVDSKKSAYYPTIDAGAYYQNLDERTVGLPGETYSGYAKVGFDIYDGGNKRALVNQKKDEYKASSYDVQEIKNSISLQVVQDFFNIQSIEATLQAKEEAQKSLKTQLDRMQAFYDAELATKDDIDRLQASYDTNTYDMEALKLEILTLKLNLSLEVGREIVVLEKSTFLENTKVTLEDINGIKSLEYSKQALSSFSKSINSAYYPHVRIEDTYSIYDYDSTSTLYPESVDNQNKLMITANIRLYDNATLSKEKQAIEINAQALDKQIQYKTKEQKMLHQLAEARITTSKIKISSALSALNAATSAFKTIEEKYIATIVDNVVYLDSLTAKTDAMSLYTTALNDLQIAYAMYYYYTGKKLEEFLND